MEIVERSRSWPLQVDSCRRVRPQDGVNSPVLTETHVQLCMFAIYIEIIASK